MLNYNIKKRVGSKMYISLVLVLFLIIILNNLVYAQPIPHNIQGTVYTNSSNGVQNGIPVKITDTVTGDIVLTYVYAPPVPALRGRWSATIDGNDGDLITVISWNSSHYGINSTTLASTTTTINIYLNITRPSETNVTILYPENNTVHNKSVPFNISANISILGGNGIDCNATIVFTDEETLNVSGWQNKTIILGNIGSGSHAITNWSVRGKREGNSNFTIRAKCASDGLHIEGKNNDSRSNITIINYSPSIRKIYLDQDIDLDAGDNKTLYCNATLFDHNLASDINNVNATFYMHSIGASAADDRNYHYTNTSCINISSSIFEINYSCGFDVAYFAYNGTWECNVTIDDYSNDTDTNKSLTRINELLAVDISHSVIDHGIMQAGNISPTDFNLTLRNAGNIPLNVSVRGYSPNESLGYLNNSMVCEINNISNDNHRYSLFEGTDFDNMFRMNNESTTIPATFYQRTEDLSYGNDSNSTHWKVEIPALTLGICNGTMIFSAITTN